MFLQMPSGKPKKLESEKKRFHFRVFSETEHGESFKEPAKSFANKIGGTVK